VRLAATEEHTKGTRAVLESPHGDPFGLLNMFREWIHIKRSRREASHKWCRRHGLAEQRLYEMAKLKKQFEDILAAGRRGGRAVAEGDAREADEQLERRGESDAGGGDMEAGSSGRLEHGSRSVLLILRCGLDWAYTLRLSQGEPDAIEKSRSKTTRFGVLLLRLSPAAVKLTGAWRYGTLAFQQGNRVLELRRAGSSTVPMPARAARYTARHTREAHAAAPAAASGGAREGAEGAAARRRRRRVRGCQLRGRRRRAGLEQAGAAAGTRAGAHGRNAADVGSGGERECATYG
jgi:hypothetical protein